MRYTVHSAFAKGLFSYLAKYQKQPAIHNPSRFAIWIIVPLSNLGLLYAPILIFSLPFQILHWCKIAPPSIGYWFLASLFSGLVFILFAIFGWAAFSQLRRQILHLEALVGFIGMGFSCWFTVFIFPRGWF